MFTLDEINEQLAKYQAEGCNIPGAVHYDSKPPDLESTGRKLIAK